MKNNVIELLREYEQINIFLDNLFYGSIEIRKTNYIYLHFRSNGISKTKYAGKNTKELQNSIIKNNEIAKRYKDKLHSLKKQLAYLGLKNYIVKKEIQKNIFYCFKYRAELVYNLAIMEGIPTYFSNIETIIDFGIVKNMSIINIIKIMNLNRAWEFILNKWIINLPTNYKLLCQINGIIQENLYYNSGEIRESEVKISGSTYIPPLPKASKVIKDINEISKKEDVNSAIELLLYVMKSQIFINGNKRTAFLFANHFLISRGLGLITIPDKKVSIFKKYLINYYEGKNNLIKAFLKEQCYIDYKSYN